MPDSIPQGEFNTPAGVNQERQTVSGAQTNLVTNYGQVFSGTIYFGSAEAIEWDKLDLARSLQKAIDDFGFHMRRYAGAQPGQNPAERYLGLRLQEMQHSKRPVPAKEGRAESNESRIGLWNALVTSYPRTVLVAGGPGSGKTTLLLFEAARLAKLALADTSAPLPMYLSLKTFTGRTEEDLIAAVGREAGIKMQVLNAIIQENRRAVCFFLDSADETPQFAAKELADTLTRIAQHLKPHHSLVVACRTGLMQKELEAGLDESDFYSLSLLPLLESEIRGLLDRYELPGLTRMLDATGLREVLQTPDILSAIAQSLRHNDAVRLPRNIGQVYQLYIDQHIFGRDDGKDDIPYDYRCVKRAILAKLAFQLLTEESSYLVHDNALEQTLVQELTSLRSKYDRCRRVMPDDWTIEGLLDTLTNSPVLERNVTAEGTPLISFTKQGYRDYYAAVYLAGQNLHELETVALTANAKKERWLQVLLILAGLKPEAAQLFDRAYSDDPLLAADVWFENVPKDIGAPCIIRQAHADEMAALKASQLETMNEPVTADLLVELLQHASPRQRLRAVNALTQWGRGAIAALLDAAEDDEPIIVAVARNALLRLGETEGISGRPLPPLIAISENGFSFHCFGGCNAQIGSLNLIRVPPNVLAQLVVNINKVDFDPFAGDAAFFLWSTSPAWFAEQWLTNLGKVDWVGLAARCRWIAQLSLAVVEQGKSRTGLANFIAELRKRAVLYDCLCYKLTEGLGLEHTPIAELDEFETAYPTIEPIYRAMRESYSRAKRSLWLNSAAGPADFSVKAVSNFTEVQAGALVFGVRVSELRLPDPTSEVQASEHRRICVQAVVNATSINGGGISGIEIQDVTDTPQPIPHRLLLDAVLNITKADNASIGGVQMRELHSHGGGIWVRSVINVTNLENADGLLGIYVGDARQVVTPASSTSAEASPLKEKEQ